MASPGVAALPLAPEVCSSKAVCESSGLIMGRIVRGCRARAAGLVPVPSAATVGPTPIPGKAAMLNRLFSNRWNASTDSRPTWEILSLALAFVRRTLTTRSPASVHALDELVYGFETYVHYERACLGRLDRALAAFLDRCYVYATKRLAHVRTSTAFMRRCERSARSQHRKTVKGRTDANPVLFTLAAWPGPLPGPGGLAVTTLLSHYCVAFGSGASLHVAPRWFHELLERWPVPGVRDVDDMWKYMPRLAGLGPAFPRTGVDLDELRTLWDSDPSQLYCDLNEVLPALERL